ncbi:hypothetical protein LT493_29605 [Streptomyces tricolor]|nr:hypothetical protein [Streptomyces tricolor]
MLRALRVAMWVVIVVEVPLYLAWLVRAGYLTGQRLDDGDAARWALPVLLLPAAVVFCAAAGWTWWTSMVAQAKSPLPEPRIALSLAFVAVASVLCGVAAVDDPSVSIGLLSVVVTGLGMVGLFFIPAVGSPPAAGRFAVAPPPDARARTGRSPPGRDRSPARGVGHGSACMNIRPPADTRVRPPHRRSSAERGLMASRARSAPETATEACGLCVRCATDRTPGPVYGQPADMDKLIELVGTLVSGAVIAVLASWLTSRARNRQEQQAEIGALRVQADAMTVAVMELQGAAAANRLLWEGAERGRTFLLTVLAFAGGAARARIAGGTDVQSGLVGFGRAAELLSRERVASKQTVAAVREPLTRAATAAAPLMRCSDPAVVTATEQLLNALSDVEDTARLEAALEAFGRAVNTATAPQLSWWARRRGGRAG